MVMGGTAAWFARRQALLSAFYQRRRPGIEEAQRDIAPRRRLAAGFVPLRREPLEHIVSVKGGPAGFARLK
jgi:hypothetical protein